MGLTVFPSPVVDLQKYQPDLHLDKRNEIETELKSTFSTMPRSPPAITFLTIVAAFSATEYAEATTRMSRVGEAILNAEKKQKRQHSRSQGNILLNIPSRCSLFKLNKKGKVNYFLRVVMVSCDF